MKKTASWRTPALCAAVIVAFALSAPPAGAASFAEGERAYLQQDYAKSLRLLKQLARRGHPKAQYLLGRQYQFGQGTAKNNVNAYYWYSKAEKRGHVEAGLFRHLLVSKRGMTEAQLAQAKKLLSGGGSGTLAAAKKNLPTNVKPAKTPRRAKTTRARELGKAVVKKSPPRKPKARTLARRPVKAPRRIAVRPRPRQAPSPSPYATAPYTAPLAPAPAPRARNGWTHPNTYRNRPCTWCRNNTVRVYRNRPRPQPYYNARRRNWPQPRYQRRYPVRPRFQRRYPVRPRFQAPRYVYRLPPWQRRQWLRRHRWRVTNDPFYRRAWRAYRRHRGVYRRQYRRW